MSSDLCAYDSLVNTGAQTRTSSLQTAQFVSAFYASSSLKENFLDIFFLITHPVEI